MCHGGVLFCHVFHQDIGCLEVSVHQTLAVHERHRTGHLIGQRENLGQQETTRGFFDSKFEGKMICEQHITCHSQSVGV